MGSDLRRFFDILTVGFVLLTLAGITEAHIVTGCDTKLCIWREWSHYKEKGCEPVTDGNCCPNRFKCPPPSTDKSVCRFNGRTFAVGSPVDHSDNCRTSCKCYSSPTGLPRIECPDNFGTSKTSKSDCRLLYKENECCSSGQICGPFNTSAATNCHVGKTYALGEKVEFEDDQCVTCICGPGLEGPEGPRCKKIDYCYLENRHRLDEGCVPVYHDDACCPTDWVCPGSNVTPVGPDYSFGIPVGTHNCTFDGQHYPLGTTLTTPIECTTCACTVPPDFACVQRRRSLCH